MMNIIDLSVRDKVLYSPSPKEKEVALVKGFTFDGMVIIKTSTDNIVDVEPSRIIKIIGKL